MPGRIRHLRINNKHSGDSVLQKILIVNSDANECREIADLLSESGYGYESVDSLEGLRSRLDSAGFMAVLLDVDSIQVENRTIRELVLKFPGVPFLCTSRDRFHPELKDAICYHIFACITKPVDPEELLYWLRCIRDEQPSG